jgi:hypothetical protein
MRWHLEFLIHKGEQPVIKRAFARIPADIQVAEQGLYVSSPRFEALDASADVFELGDKIAEALNLASAGAVEIEAGCPT